MEPTSNREVSRGGIWPRVRSMALWASVVLGLLYAVLWLVFKPSNDRHWADDQSRLAQPEISPDGILTVNNVRNARYRSATDFDVAWETRSYPLNELNTLWYIVEPFEDWRGPAHTFLSFGFEDGRYLAVSVEIRKEAGETFSPVLGLLRQYELAYVYGDERDLIGLRAVHRKDDVHLYRMRATPGQARAILESMVTRTRAIETHPEFYNTLTNTCTSNIVEHVSEIAPGTIPWSYRTVLPGWSDDLAYELGLIDTDLPLEQYRSAHQINTLAEQYADDEQFSTWIRSKLP